MKIRYEDYPLLSGGKVKATKYNNDANLLQHRSWIVKENLEQGKRIYFTDTAMREVDAHSELINSTMNTAIDVHGCYTKILTEGNYCVLFRNGISTYMKVDHRFPNVIPYMFERDEVIEGDLVSQACVFALACLVWFQKAELKTITLDKINRKIKTRNDTYFNETKSDVKVIDLNWNTTTIQTSEFWVKSHVAIRWIGTGRKDFKIVMIQPFKKHGYTRRAGIEKAGEESALNQAKDILNNQ